MEMTTGAAPAGGIVTFKDKGLRPKTSYFYSLGA